MRKRNIPFALASSIYDIDVSFYKKLGIKALLVDLDNTLDHNKVALPGEKTFLWRDAVKREGIRIFILSNNSGQRVGRYATALEVEHRCFMRKPFAGPLKRFLKEEGFAPEDVLLIGDQIQTDILAGNGAGVRCILTEPLDPTHEPPWTVFNRLFDKPKRKKIKKLRLAPDWKEVLHE